MHKKIEHRIEQLEAQAQPKVIGLRWLNATWQGKDPDVIQLSGLDETMSLEEFERRYPGGTIVNIEYTRNWRAGERV